MTHKKPLVLRLIALAGAVTITSSCTTTYDYYGRPVYSVDPAIAVAGVAAAGIAGYAIGKNNRDRNYYGNRNYARYDRGYGGGHGGGHGRPCRY
jgi:hypothetical protein